MLTKKIIGLMGLLVMVVLVAGCGPAQAATEAATNDERHQEAADGHHADESGDHGAEMDGHGEEGGGHEHVAAPHEFEDMRNPLVEDAAALAAGQTIFQANCAMCHGPAGNGDGPAAEALDPKPASLADTAMMQDLSDGYLY